MNGIENMIQKKIEEKSAELEKMQAQFGRFWEDEKEDLHFEPNAIRDLIAMHRLKGEIKELKDLALYCEIAQNSASSSFPEA